MCKEYFTTLAHTQKQYILVKVKVYFPEVKYCAAEPNSTKGSGVHNKIPIWYQKYSTARGKNTISLMVKVHLTSRNSYSMSKKKTQSFCSCIFSYWESINETNYVIILVFFCGSSCFSLFSWSWVMFMLWNFYERFTIPSTIITELNGRTASNSLMLVSADSRQGRHETLEKRTNISFCQWEEKTVKPVRIQLLSVLSDSGQLQGQPR